MPEVVKLTIVPPLSTSVTVNNKSFSGDVPPKSVPKILILSFTAKFCPNFELSSASNTVYEPADLVTVNDPPTPIGSMFDPPTPVLVPLLPVNGTLYSPFKSIVFPEILVINRASPSPLSTAIAVVMPAESVRVIDVESTATSSAMLASVPAAPASATPVILVPGTNALDPETGPPDSGASPKNAIFVDPEGVSNFEATEAVVPLLSTVNVGFPIALPV